MAIKTCKGTKLQQRIASVYTDVAQLISINLPEAQSETFEADTLDNASAGIPHKPTGRTEGGSASAELFYDPDLAGHQAITDLLAAPALQDWKIVFVGGKEFPFTGAGLKFGGVVALNDGLKGSMEIKLDGLGTWPS